MKLNGQQVNVRARKLTRIPRPDGEPVGLWIAALPLGFEEKVEQLFPSPVAPERLIWKSKGIPERDGDGRPMTKPDTNDPDYKKASARSTQLQGTFYVYQSLVQAEQNNGLAFDSVLGEDTPAGWTKFMDEIRQEFKDAGLSSGDLSLLMTAVLDVNNLSGEKIKEAMNDFLSLG